LQLTNQRHQCLHRQYPDEYNRWATGRPTHQKLVLTEPCRLSHVILNAHNQGLGHPEHPQAAACSLPPSLSQPHLLKSSSMCPTSHAANAGGLDGRDASAVLQQHAVAAHAPTDTLCDQQPSTAHQHQVDAAVRTNTPEAALGLQATETPHYAAWAMLATRTHPSSWGPTHGPWPSLPACHPQAAPQYTHMPTGWVSSVTHSAARWSGWCGW
jgi:hypothetical protein